MKREVELVMTIFSCVFLAKSKGVVGFSYISYVSWFNNFVVFLFVLCELSGSIFKSFVLFVLFVVALCFKFKIYNLQFSIYN